MNDEMMAVPAEGYKRSDWRIRDKDAKDREAQSTHACSAGAAVGP